MQIELAILPGNVIFSEYPAQIPHHVYEDTASLHHSASLNRELVVFFTYF